MFAYESQYDSSSLRGIDVSERPWDLKKEIFDNSQSGSKLLDVGCGTASKLIPLINYFSEIYGIDISHKMVAAAKAQIKNNKIENIKLFHGDSQNLPFHNNSFDTVTCMLSRWNVLEIARILKSTGNVIVEHIGCEDKKDFKVFFGKDKDGWRGQFINCQVDRYIQSFIDMFREYFEFVTIKNGFWKTYYTEQGILDLLQYTPTINNFNLYTDIDHVKNACDTFRRPKGIELTQNRILIHAKNPRVF